MDNLLSIGEMAKVNSISVQTLRFYCNKGLITPRYIDQESGYRYFDISQSYLVDNIQFLQEIGLSLKEIKYYLESSCPELALEFLSKNLNLLEEKQNRLTMIEKATSFLKEQILMYTDFDEIGTVSYKYFDEKIIHSYKFEPVDFYNDGIFEYYVRELKSMILDSNVTMGYFYNICSSISESNVKERRFLANRIYIHGTLESKYQLEYEEIPKGVYAVIYFENYEKEQYYRDKLINDIKRKGVQIVGDLYCESVLDIPMFQNLERQSLLSLRIKITD